MADRDRDALRIIAANLRRLRVEKGLSMRALAELAEDYAPAIKRIEDEENMPGVGLLIRIAAALQVSLNDFVKPVKKMAHAS